MNLTEYGIFNADKLKDMRANYLAKIERMRSRHHAEKRSKLKQFVANNADKLKRMQANYRARNADKIKRMRAEYRAKNA